MLTIFTTPKPFIGHNKIIQENAIRSWKRLTPACEVILVGNDEGVSEAARLFNCVHISDVLCSENGIPYVRSLFEAAEHVASNRILCYANCDIMFTDSLTQGLGVLDEKRQFLLVGRRHNVDITCEWDFGCETWQDNLKKYVTEHGVLNTECGMDYFMFPKGTIKEIPDIVVGRAWWDSWMIYNARRKHIFLIDASNSILAVHQNHDYSHCVGGKEAVYQESPDTQKNISFVNYGKSYMGVHDALWVLDSGRLRLATERFSEHLLRLPLVYPLLFWPKEKLYTILNTTPTGKQAYLMFKGFYNMLCKNIKN